MEKKPMDIAFESAAKAAAPGNHWPPRKKWIGQKEWDYENMATESTRFTRAQDARLRRCCREAGINRSQLISYMLLSWMSLWEAARKEEGHGSDFALSNM